MTRDQIHRHFDEMRLAASDDDTEKVVRLYEEAQRNGHEFRLLTSETTDWSWEDGDKFKYATVTQNSKLMLGDEVVAEWRGTYIGEYGSMGTGWWTTMVDSSGPDDGVSELLDILDIDRETPLVPEPIEIVPTGDSAP